jgi:hypothetical protein
MLSNAGLNTYSNRTAKVELKEDDEDHSFMRKTEFRLMQSENPKARFDEEKTREKNSINLCKII